MLVKMARQYRRPLLTFYMSGPPRVGSRGQDFRTLPDGHSPGDDALLHVLIRTIYARQGIIRAALEDEDEAPRREFIGSSTMSNGVPAVVSSIRGTLGHSLADFRSETSSEAAFASLRGAAEDIGIFVLLMGNLGSHHTAIALDVFRGFALADDIAPLIVINDADSRAAWSFTLVHELAHLWLGETGTSGVSAEAGTELFCNRVAGEFLLPTEDLKHESIDVNAGVDAVSLKISELAEYWNLSSSMVAYRLYQVRLIDHRMWTLLSESFRDLWLRGREKRRRLARERPGGPNYYVVKRHRVGAALLQVTGRMLDAGALTTSKAARVLCVKAKQVQLLLQSGGSRTEPRRS